MLAIHVAGGIVVEDEHQAGQACQGCGAKMGEVRHTRHLDFDRHGDLALDLFCTAAGPLGDDLHVVVGDVGIGLDGKIAERDDAPHGEDKRSAEHHPAVFESEFNQSSKHYCVPAVSRSNALVTTWVPGARPERICWRLPSSELPARTSTRLNWLFPMGTKTQSRSWRCSTASAGTTVNVCFLILENVAVTNMPSLRIPGFGTWMRTLAVRREGSRTGPMSLTRPLSTRSG